MHNSHRSLQEIDHCLRQLLPETGRKHLLRFLPLAILGVVLSASCHLSRIAAGLAFAGEPRTLLQRLRRWIMRSSFAVTEVLPELARGFVACCAADPLPLLVDRTEWKHANLLVAAVPFRGRAIPVAIMILPGPKATNAAELSQLLEMAALALRPAANIVVVGDREFGNIPAIRAICRRGWHFCLRFKNYTWFYDGCGAQWQARDAFTPRRRMLWSDVQITLQRYGPVQCALAWQEGEDTPWVLVSDLPATGLRRIYRQRMRIDEMFSDLKGRGFDLEATRLRDPDRILRLAVLLCLAYLWLLMVAWHAVRRGLRRHVDPAMRRALSYLQIALRILHHQPPRLVQRLLRAASRTLRQSEG